MFSTGAKCHMSHTSQNHFFQNEKKYKIIIYLILILILLFLKVFIPRIHSIIRSDWTKISPKTSFHWNGGVRGFPLLPEKVQKVDFNASSKINIKVENKIHYVRV